MGSKRMNGDIQSQYKRMFPSKQVEKKRVKKVARDSYEEGKRERAEKGRRSEERGWETWMREQDRRAHDYSSEQR